MPCNKSYWQPCPQMWNTTPNCCICPYFSAYIGISDLHITYYPQVAKTIDQFTNEELLAELQRRLRQ